MIVQVDDRNTRSVCEQQWSQTVPGKGWFTILRLYGASDQMKSNW